MKLIGDGSTVASMLRRSTHKQPEYKCSLRSVTLLCRMILNVVPTHCAQLVLRVAMGSSVKNRMMIEMMMRFSE